MVHAIGGTPSSAKLGQSVGTSMYVPIVIRMSIRLGIAQPENDKLSLRIVLLFVGKSRYLMQMTVGK